jgi:hypothetical protein
MKRKTTLLIASFAAITIANAARAADFRVIAGWDFSQYWAEGTLYVDSSFVAQDTLDANYSDFDPTFGAGAESAAYGTLYFDGSNGSTNVNETAFPPDFTPTSLAPGGPSLASNLGAPQNGIPVNDVAFDAHTILDLEGQEFQTYLSMTATTALDVVFEADLTGAGQSAQDWRITFGAQTFSGNETEVSVEFSTDGVNYTSYGSVIVDSTDTQYSVNLATGFATQGYVRLAFDPSSQTGGQPVIDNVAIEANFDTTPVPSISSGGLALLAGLVFGIAAWAGRRR